MTVQEFKAWLQGLEFGKNTKEEFCPTKEEWDVIRNKINTLPASVVYQSPTYAYNPFPNIGLNNSVGSAQVMYN